MAQGSHPQFAKLVFQQGDLYRNRKIIFIGFFHTIISYRDYTNVSQLVKDMFLAVPLNPFSDSLISKDAEDKPGIQLNIEIYISLKISSDWIPITINIKKKLKRATKHIKLFQKINLYSHMYIKCNPDLNFMFTEGIEPGEVCS